MQAELIGHMGSDLTVVNAARVSFDKESEWEVDDWDGFAPKERHRGKHLSPKDEKLISYLARHNHWTPFSHPQITLRETVPIFVARQRFKHVVGFTYNEVSRRYVTDDPVFYTPDIWFSKPENNIKQGQGTDQLETFNEHCLFQGSLKDYYEKHIEYSALYYSNLISADVSPQQARMVLPQSMYTSYYVTGSLAAFARAYHLRSKEDAQYEIQQLAKQWDEIIRPLYPVSWKALTSGT